LGLGQKNLFVTDGQKRDYLSIDWQCARGAIKKRKKRKLKYISERAKKYKMEDGGHFEHEALLLQRDCVTRLPVQILQLQNIPFANDCNQQMTLKFIRLRS